MNSATINASIVQPSKSSETSLESHGVFYQLDIKVIGIKKRCRKSESHCFNLGYIPYNNGAFDKEEISDKVQAFLQTNMKEVHSLTRVLLYHVVIKNEGNFTVTQWEPFSDKNVKLDLNIYIF